MRSYAAFKGLIMMILMYFIIFANASAQSGNSGVAYPANPVKSEGKTPHQNGLPDDCLTGVIELRNYRLKPGKRDEFINYFKQHFVDSQNEAGAQILGLFRPKGSVNNFFWLRGFASMKARRDYLPAFYYGPVWKAFGRGANELLSNNDDVYLLKPLVWDDQHQIKAEPVHLYIKENFSGITVVTFYTCNHKLDKMIDFIGKTYLPVFKTFHTGGITFWVSEMAENDFPKLPVFQDQNLLVSIAHYENEAEFNEVTRQIARSLTAEQRDALEDAATKTDTLVLYPVQD